MCLKRRVPLHDGHLVVEQDQVEVPPCAQEFEAFLTVVGDGGDPDVRVGFEHPLEPAHEKRRIVHQEEFQGPERRLGGKVPGRGDPIQRRLRLGQSVTGPLAGRPFLFPHHLVRKQPVEPVEHGVHVHQFGSLLVLKPHRFEHQAFPALADGLDPGVPVGNHLEIPVLPLQNVVEGRLALENPRLGVEYPAVPDKNSPLPPARNSRSSPCSTGRGKASGSARSTAGSRHP